MCIVEINWKLSNIDLTRVNHIKDKKNVIGILLSRLWGVFWGHFHTLMVNFNDKSTSKP